MGIGFVLFLYTVAGLVLAAIGGSVAAGVCGFLAKRKGVRVWPVGLVAFGFPFLCVGFCGVAFLGYADYCGTVRNVDPGLGDWWQVPIGHGYTFVMIDVTEIGSVHTGDGGEMYRFVTGIGVKGDYAAIMQDIPAEMPGRESFVEETQGMRLPAWSMLDLRTGKETTFPDEKAFLAAARAQGIAAVDIMSPVDFYERRRWGVSDVVFPLIVAGVIGFCAVLLIRRFRESLRAGPILAMNEG